MDLIFLDIKYGFLAFFFAAIILFFHKIFFFIYWGLFIYMKSSLIFIDFNNFLFSFKIYFGYYILFCVLRFIYIYGFHGDLPVKYASNRDTWFFGNTFHKLSDSLKEEILEDPILNPKKLNEEIIRNTKENIFDDDEEDDKKKINKERYRKK